MMRSHAARGLALAGALGLSTLVFGSTRTHAQDIVAADGSTGPARHHGLHRLWDCLHHRNPPIPRTYSYYYQTWFNQPCHSKVVGPDGHVRWQTTVRGLPLGTPWPSY
jgi:hypothetical protein